MSLLKFVIQPLMRSIATRNHERTLHVSSQVLVGNFKDNLRSLKTQLEAIIGSQHVICSESVREQHGQDKGPDKGQPPDVVVFPSSTEDVSEVCKVCSSMRSPIIPYGTGTGLESGISAVHGGVCIDMSRMNAISDYHPEDFDVVVQPGVKREDLNDHTKDDGLWFTVDTVANASICGMLATGASGTNSVRYGTMKENCLNMEVVLSDGRIINTVGKGKRPRKNSAGFNLTNLFLGSEGTLGVITKGTLRLHGLPECVTAAVVAFPTIKAAIETVIAILQCCVPIARIELLDDLSVKACNQYSQLSNSEQPTLFIEFQGSEEAVESQTSLVQEISKSNGGSDFQWASKQEERTKLWMARNTLLYAAIALRPGSRSVVTDVCCPLSNLAELIRESKEDILKCGITGPILGHVCDGNFHAFLLFDPNVPEEYETCKQISHRMAHRAIEMGGTCTGEHGIGTGKMNLLKTQIGLDAVGIMGQIKSTLDPLNIMNPGKVVAIE